MDPSWVAILEVPGNLQAELLRGLLEAQGVEVRLSQEAAGRALGLGVAPLGGVHLLVPASQQQAAEAVLEAYYTGAFEAEAGDEIARLNSCDYG